MSSQQLLSSSQIELRKERDLQDQYPWICDLQERLHDGRAVECHQRIWKRYLQECKMSTKDRLENHMCAQKDIEKGNMFYRGGVEETMGAVISSYWFS